MKGRPLSTSPPASVNGILYSYTEPERGGLQRTDRAVTTCHLPLPPVGHNQIWRLTCTRAPCSRKCQLLVFPRVPDPTDRQVKNTTTSEDTTNRSSRPRTQSINKICEWSTKQIRSPFFWRKNKWWTLELKLGKRWTKNEILKDEQGIFIPRTTCRYFVLLYRMQSN